MTGQCGGELSLKHVAQPSNPAADWTEELSRITAGLWGNV